MFEQILYSVCFSVIFFLFCLKDLTEDTDTLNQMFNQEEFNIKPQTIRYRVDKIFLVPKNMK